MCSINDKYFSTLAPVSFPQCRTSRSFCGFRKTTKGSDMWPKIDWRWERRWLGYFHQHCCVWQHNLRRAFFTIICIYLSKMFAPFTTALQCNPAMTIPCWKYSSPSWEYFLTISELKWQWNMGMIYAKHYTGTNIETMIFYSWIFRMPNHLGSYFHWKLVCHWVERLHASSHCHYVHVKWPSWHLELPVDWVFLQQFL